MNYKNKMKIMKKRLSKPKQCGILLSSKKRFREIWTSYYFTKDGVHESNTM